MVNGYQKNILITEQFNKAVNRLSSLVTFNEKIDIFKLKDSILDTLKMTNYFKLSITEDLDLREIENNNDNIVFVYRFDKDYEMQNFINDKKESIFKIGEPLLEIDIIACNNKYYLLGSFHHAVYDGVSMNLLLDVLIKNYYRYINKEELAVIERIDNEILDKEKRYKTLKSYKRDEDYWNSKVEISRSIKSIFDNRINDFSGRRIEKVLDNEYTKKVKEFCNNNNVSETTFFMTCLLLAIKPYFNSSLVSIGTSIHNRDKKEYSKLCMKTNTIPFIIDMNYSGSFIDWTNKVKGELFEILHHGRYARYDLCEMYKIIFSYQVNKFECEDVDFSCQWLYSNKAAVPLTFSVADFCKLGRYKFYLDYNKSSLNDKFADLILNRFLDICKEVLSNNENIIGSGTYVTIREKREIAKINSTETSISKDKTIVDLFEENVITNPDKIALVYKDKLCSYKELDYYANKAANLLISKNIKPGDKVCIIFDKSLEMVYAIWGIIKTGACYVPIDSKWPDERIKHIINSCKSKMVIVSDKLKIINCNAEVIRYSDTLKFSGNLKKVSIRYDNPTYIIYTSGSTGVPKGVVVSNKNIMNLAFDKVMNITKNDVFLQLINYTFDVSVMGYLISLIKGATTIIAPDDIILDPELTAEMVYDNKVTVLNTTTALLREWIPFIDKFKGMRRIMTGGEKLTSDVARKVMPYLDGILVNGYGPTETTVYSTAKIITSNSLDNISIGKPILNTEVYILDENTEMTAVMECGQLYIAGQGVCKGYVDKCENKRFIQNPFGEGILYATGDICYFTPENEINYVGRLDSQIKVNGYRIETSEVESVINQINGITNSIVVMENNNLAAYLTSNKEISRLEIINFLGKKLPKYMIPNNYYIISKIPLTSNGKVDHKSLTNYVVKRLSINSDLKAINDEEERIKKVFSEILLIDEISTNVSFFALGGNSIQAMKVVSKIKEEMNIKLSVSDFYEHSSISELADFLKESEHISYNTIKKAKAKDKYRLAPSQEMIFSVWNMDKDSKKYNIPVIIRLNEHIDIEKLESCINRVILENESMRTRIVLFNDIPYQVIDDYRERKIKVYKVDEKLDDYSRLFKPFDLFNEYAFRFSIIQDIEAKYLFLEFHHYMFDGISISIILDKLTKLYRGKEHNEHIEDKIQNKDYSEYILSLEHKSEEEFWKSNLLKTTPANIKENIVRDIDNIDETSRYEYTFSKELSEKIHNEARNISCSLHNYMLSIFCILLSKYNNEGNLTIGTILSGRTEKEFESVVGMMVDTIPVVFNINKEESAKKALKDIVSFVGKAYDNAKLGFNNIVRVTNPRREINRNSLFDIMFVMQDMNFNTDLGTVITDESMQIDEKFDFTVEVQDSDKIRINITFKKNLYKELDIELMVKRYEMMFYEVYSSLDIAVDDINILTELDKKLINKFNSGKIQYPKELSAAHLFYKIAKKYPLNTAVIKGDSSINYRKLLKRASEIAVYLNKNNIGKGNCVGLYCIRSIEMIEAIFGVILSGAAYLPIDIKLPEKRIQHMLNECEVNTVITFGTDENIIPNNVKKINISNIKCSGMFAKTVEPQNSPNDLIYIMYTSGSTGMPKGVGVEHHNVVELVYGEEKYKRYLNISNYAFDGSVYDIFSAILNGGSITIIDEVDAMDPVSIAKVIKDNSIQSFFIPTALFNTFTKDEFLNMKSVEKMFVGGEKLSAPHVKNALKYIPNAIYNGYGPTEATVFSTSYHISGEENDSIPIGRPFKNTKIYIMDDKNRLCPIGINGNLNISGPGVSRGYIKNKEFTQERFRADLIEDERLYISGDLGRWDINGNVEYIGRKDSQVKLRGFRIELNEIKNALLNIESISEAEVLVKEIDGNKELYAYYVMKDDADMSEQEIKMRLKYMFPEYMIPRFFKKIHKMPLTTNGKVDKKKLLSIEVNKMSTGEYIEPKTDMEKLIADKWKKLFNVDKVSAYDDFFEIGGHSIQAIKFISEMKESGIDLSVKDVMNNSKLYKLAEVIESNTQKQVESAYKRNLIFSIEKQGKFHKIRDGGKNVIFIFPTYMLNIAYEVTFSKMVERFDGWTCYLGNFTDSSEYVNQYLKDVLKYSRKADRVIFIGYSFGGCLAYEVAKLAEKKGVNIDKLIILDSFFKKNCNNGYDSFADGIKDIKELRSFLEERFAFYRNLQEDIKESIENCFLAFFENTRNLVNTKEVINASISYLLAENQEFDVEDTREMWKEGCTKEYKEYKGFGKHNDMLNQENMNKNVHIIDKLLK